MYSSVYRPSLKAVVIFPFPLSVPLLGATPSPLLLNWVCLHPDSFLVIYLTSLIVLQLME